MTRPAWILASRPKTLTANFVPVMTGTALASTYVRIDWIAAFSALLSALLVQVGINLFNDAIDFEKGADTDKRLGFIRVTQAGLLTHQQVIAGGYFVYMLALLVGIPMFLKGGLPMVAIVLFSMILGYLYTGGPYPLAYVGLGDLFVLLFFGWICTGSVFFLQTGYFNGAVMVAGAQVGLLSTVMIAINNLRDMYQDRDANKRTLAVIFGKTFARWEITVLLLLPFLLNLYWHSIIPYVTLPITIPILRFIWTHEPSREYNMIFGKAALLHLLFGLTLCIDLLK